MCGPATAKQTSKKESSGVRSGSFKQVLNTEGFGTLRSYRRCLYFLCLGHKSIGDHEHTLFVLWGLCQTHLFSNCQQVSTIIFIIGRITGGIIIIIIIIIIISMVGNIHIVVVGGLELPWNHTACEQVSYP